MTRLTASLVLYKSEPEEFETSMRSFLAAPADGVLVVSDNSPRPLRSELFVHPRVVYIHNGSNLGFGSGHNRAFRAIADRSDCHLLLNPDVAFGADVLPYLAGVMAADLTIGAIMPQIRYADGSLQRLCKLLPTPADLIVRRFLPQGRWTARQQQRYEMFGLPQDRPSVVPTLSGCFLLVRSSIFARVGGFDENFFMYMEDFDLVRRIADHGTTVYDPHVHIIHHYQKGSYRNRRLLGYHLRSAVRYFNKWGWLVDAERASRNRLITAQIDWHRNGDVQ
jgi:GT2 family glycosyltransferase